jgi:hypothetical protein
VCGGRLPWGLCPSFVSIFYLILSYVCVYAVSMHVYVNVIRRHEHTRVHARTDPRRHARRQTSSAGVSQTPHPRLVRGQALHTDHRPPSFPHETQNTRRRTDRRPINYKQTHSPAQPLSGLARVVYTRAASRPSLCARARRSLTYIYISYSHAVNYCAQ